MNDVKGPVSKRKDIAPDFRAAEQAVDRFFDEFKAMLINVIREAERNGPA